MPPRKGAKRQRSVSTGVVGDVARCIANAFVMRCDEKSMSSSMNGPRHQNVYWKDLLVRALTLRAFPLYPLALHPVPLYPLAHQPPLLP